MEKFCKYCGKKIPSDSVVCPKCGRQVNFEKAKKTNPEKENNNKIKEEQKFYEQKWFMWLMLILFGPVGILLMWKFHPELKKNTKIILTIIFALLFIIIITGMNDEETNNNNSDSKSMFEEIEVIDFKSLKRSEIESWCKSNEMSCNFTEEYSDTIKKSAFIRQEPLAKEKVYKKSTIKIVYSLGKKPSIEYLNALEKAKTYAETLYMSKKAIYKQLTSEYGEQFSNDAATYAINNLKVNWKENALVKAKTYSDMNMSKKAIYEQLVSEYGEQFTSSEAQYAIDHLE